MALNVTAVEVPNKWAVRLTAIGAVGTVTWFRDINGKQTLVGDGEDIIDRTVPLNTDVYYVAVDDADVEVSGIVNVRSEYPILSSSMFGNAYSVTIVSQTPNTWRGRSAWHPIIDRTDGPVVSVFQAEWREGEVVIDLVTREMRSNILLMLMNGDPLILRATCPDRVDDITMLPLEWSDPWIPDGTFVKQRLNLRYQSVTPERPAWTPPPMWTYQEALNIHQTYEDWFIYRDYQALLIGVPG